MSILSEYGLQSNPKSAFMVRVTGISSLQPYAAFKKPANPSSRFAGPLAKPETGLPRKLISGPALALALAAATLVPSPTKAERLVPGGAMVEFPPSVESMQPDPTVMADNRERFAQLCLLAAKWYQPEVRNAILGLPPNADSKQYRRLVEQVRHRLQLAQTIYPFEAGQIELLISKEAFQAKLDRARYGLSETVSDAELQRVMAERKPAVDSVLEQLRVFVAQNSTKPENKGRVSLDGQPAGKLKRGIINPAVLSEIETRLALAQLGYPLETDLNLARHDLRLRHKQVGSLYRQYATAVPAQYMHPDLINGQVDKAVWNVPDEAGWDTLEAVQANREVSLARILYGLPLNATNEELKAVQAEVNLKILLSCSDGLVGNVPGIGLPTGQDWEFIDGLITRYAAQLPTKGTIAPLKDMIHYVLVTGQHPLLKHLGRERFLGLNGMLNFLSPELLGVSH